MHVNLLSFEPIDKKTRTSVPRWPDPLKIMVEIAECYCDQTYGLMILEAINIVPGNGE